MYGGKIFSRIFHVPDKWRERLSFATVHARMLRKERFCTERFQGIVQTRSLSVPTRNGSIHTVPKSCVNAALDRFVEFRYSLACMNFLSLLDSTTLQN